MMSVALHVAVIAAGVIGLPYLDLDQQPVPEIPVVIDTVELGGITNLPTARERPEQKEKPEPEKAEVPEPPPPPPPEVKPAPPPPPPPKEEPKEEKTAAVVPEPEKVPEAKPEPEPKEQPKPEPKKEVKKEPPQPDPLVKAKPKRKPKPPDPLAGVLKTLEKLKRTPPPEEKAEGKAEKKDEKTEFEQQIAVALARRPKAHDPDRRITMSERDALVAAVKRQLEPCWNLPAGAKDIGEMIIEIKVSVSQDGSIRSASIQNSSRMFSDPFYRAAAESALRAVKNPRCSPLQLPADKYDVWKDLTLSFNPRDLVGG